MITSTDSDGRRHLVRRGCWDEASVLLTSRQLHSLPHLIRVSLSSMHESQRCENDPLMSKLLTRERRSEHLGLLALQAAVALSRRQGADAHLGPALPDALDARETRRVVDREQPDRVVPARCLSAVLPGSLSAARQTPCLRRGCLPTHLPELHRPEHQASASTRPAGASVPSARSGRRWPHSCRACPCELPRWRRGCASAAR